MERVLIYRQGKTKMNKTIRKILIFLTPITTGVIIDLLVKHILGYAEDVALIIGIITLAYTQLRIDIAQLKEEIKKCR